VEVEAAAASELAEEELVAAAVAAGVAVAAGATEPLAVVWMQPGVAELSEFAVVTFWKATPVAKFAFTPRVMSVRRQFVPPGVSV